LLALGFDHSVLAVFNRRLRDAISAVADVRVWAKDEDEIAALLYQAIHDSATALSATAGALALQAGDPPTTLGPLLAEVKACQDAIYAAEEYERELEAAWRELPEDDPQKANKPSERTSSYGVRGLASAMDELVSWLESSVGRSFRRRAYFLTGQA